MIGPAGAQQCKPSRLPRGGLAPSQNGGPIAIGLHCVQRRIRLPSAPSRRASRRRSFRSIGPSESRHLPSHPPRSQQTPMLRPPRRRHRSANDRVGIRTPGRAEVSPRRARLRPLRISGQEHRRVFLPDGSRDPSSSGGDVSAKADDSRPATSVRRELATSDWAGWPLRWPQSFLALTGVGRSRISMRDLEAGPAGFEPAT
jgi:hypothetical protein